MAILKLIATCPLLLMLLCLYLNRKRIDVDYSRHMIYGWYDGEILASERFNPSWSIDEIMKKKSLVEKELDIAIKKYKQLKNK